VYGYTALCEMCGATNSQVNSLNRTMERNIINREIMSWAYHREVLGIYIFGKIGINVSKYCGGTNIWNNFKSGIHQVLSDRSENRFI